MYQSLPLRTIVCELDLYVNCFKCNLFFFTEELKISRSLCKYIQLRIRNVLLHSIDGIIKRSSLSYAFDLTVNLNVY